jgi:hypothetical protein
MAQNPCDDNKLFILAIVNPAEQAQAYRDVFGECCMEDVKLLLGKIQNCAPSAIV